MAPWNWPNYVCFVIYLLIFCTYVFNSGRLIGNVDIEVSARQLLASFLQVALLSDDLISACTHDPDASFANLARDHERFSGELLVVLAKCVCTDF